MVGYAVTIETTKGCEPPAGAIAPALPQPRCRMGPFRKFHKPILLPVSVSTGRQTNHSSSALAKPVGQGLFCVTKTAGMWYTVTGADKEGGPVEKFRLDTYFLWQRRGQNLGGNRGGPAHVRQRRQGGVHPVFEGWHQQRACGLASAARGIPLLRSHCPGHGVYHEPAGERTNRPKLPPAFAGGLCHGTCWCWTR